MSAINTETWAAWQHIAAEASKTRPSVGCRIRVNDGRKHRGAEGLVVHHMVSRYYDPFRYASEAQAHMREMRGREGYVVRVRPDEGPEFWVRADYVQVLESAS